MGGCLKITGCKARPNATVDTRDACTSVPSSCQMWQIHGNGSIASAMGGLCLQITGATAPWAVGVATCTPSPNQVFQVQPLAKGGTVTISQSYGGVQLCVDNVVPRRVLRSVRPSSSGHKDGGGCPKMGDGHHGRVRIQPIVNLSYISCTDANCSTRCELVSGPWPLDKCMESIYGGRKVQLVGGSIRFLTYKTPHCQGVPTPSDCAPGGMKACPIETCRQYNAPRHAYEMYTLTPYAKSCQQYGERCELYSNMSSNCCRGRQCDPAYAICE
eukprot:COSAG01_NODE_1116_length_11642_cov_7.561899_5_plen_272_part_00